MVHPGTLKMSDKNEINLDLMKLFIIYVYIM